MRRRALSCLVIACAFAPSLRAETITLRGGQVLEEPVVRIDIAGVQVGGDAPRTIGWDAIRSVAGARSGEAAPFMELAELAWRARVRLDRGDVALAAPLFRELFDACAGANGPTPLLAAEGLARCELARGVPTAALEPWLESLRLRRLGARLAGEQNARDRDEWIARRPLTDADTALIPALAPIWLDGPAVDGLAQTLAERAALGSDLDERLRQWYAIGATWESTRSTDEGALASLARQSLAPSAPPGERLVAAIVMARAGSSEQRANARAMLDTIAHEELGSWREAWARLGLGRSLLLEAEIAQRERGLMHLLHVPARFQEALPHLSAIALAHASLETARSSNHQAADQLRAELAALATYHAGAAQALAWLDARAATTVHSKEPA